MGICGGGLLLFALFSFRNSTGFFFRGAFPFSKVFLAFHRIYLRSESFIFKSIPKLRNKSQNMAFIFSHILGFSYPSANRATYSSAANCSFPFYFLTHFSRSLFGIESRTRLVNSPILSPNNPRMPLCPIISCSIVACASDTFVISSITI